MEQALALQHLHIGNSGKIRIFLEAFLDGAGLIYLGLVRSQVARQLSDVGGNTEACESYSFLIVMLFNVVNRLTYHNQVQCLGEWCVISSRTGHVDDSFLESNDLSCSHYCHAFQGIGLSFSYCVNFRDHAREDASSSLNLYTWLDDILYRSDSYRLTWLRDVE